VHTECCWGNLKEGDNLEDLVVGGRIILKLFLSSRVGGGCMDWMDQDQDGGRWRAFVNVAVNLRVT
jgi:hypothetical protein